MSPPPSARAFDPGFTATPVDQLLQEAEEPIARIRLCFGIGNESFAQEVLPLIRGYAGFVHRLPATADHYFSRPGGLLRLGLEVGFYSLQGTDAHIFAGRSTITVRRQLEPRWRHATFAAGLCCELHRVLSHLAVSDPAGEEWPAYLSPLSTWLLDRSVPHYEVRWRPNPIESRSLGLFALRSVLPPQTLVYLSEGNSVIVPHLLASIAGLPVYRDHNVLDQLVRRSLALVIDRHLRTDADRHVHRTGAPHLERHVVDAMRQLATEDARWTANTPKSRVWFGPEGLFLLWPQSTADIQQRLDDEHLAGVPRTHDAWLDLLLACGLIEPHPDGQPLWDIHPLPPSRPQEAIKLCAHGLLFAADASTPPRLDQSLLTPRPGTPPTPSPTQGPASPAHRPHRPPAPPSARVGEQFSLIDPSPDADAAPTPPLPDPGARSPEPRTPHPLPPDPPANQNPGPETPAAQPEPPVDTPPPPPAPPRPTYHLRPTLRLNPALRDALSSIVDTLNGPASAAVAGAIGKGLFVPLDELAQRGFQPAMAARALADARMLVPTPLGGTPMESHDFAGKPSTGLVIDPRWIEGFDLAAFTTRTDKP